MSDSHGMLLLQLSFGVYEQTHMPPPVDRLYIPMAQNADSVDSQTQHEARASSGVQTGGESARPLSALVRTAGP